jgi:hypothetical protein
MTHFKEMISKGEVSVSGWKRTPTKQQGYLFSLSLGVNLKVCLSSIDQSSPLRST